MRGRLSRDLPRKEQFGFMSGANVNPMIFRPRRVLGHATVEGCEVGRESVYTVTSLGH